MNFHFSLGISVNVLYSEDLGMKSTILEMKATHSNGAIYIIVYICHWLRKWLLGILMLYYFGECFTL